MRATASLFRVAFIVLVLSGPAGAAMADAAAGLADVTEETAKSSCPPGDASAANSHCTVDKFDVLGTVGDRQLVYGLYTDRTPDDYTLRTAVIVYERRPGGNLRPLVEADDPGSIYGEPKLVESAGRILLHLPGYEDGTGNFNVERLYVWRDNAWTLIDTDAWHKDFAAKLPPGYEVWKGIFPDYAKMTAATPLWRAKTDGNCCPTGGRADILLAWQSDRLVLKSVRIRLGAKYANF